MQQCPFCMQEKRGLGAILIFTAKGYADPNALPAAGGQACDTCIQIFGLMLDNWRNGGINGFVEKMKAAGLIQFQSRN